MKLQSACPMVVLSLLKTQKHLRSRIGFPVHHLMSSLSGSIVLISIYIALEIYALNLASLNHVLLSLAMCRTNVITNKGNLRRGRWKSGAYDPNVSPRGLLLTFVVHSSRFSGSLPLPGRIDSTHPQHHLTLMSSKADILLYTIATDCPIIRHQHHSKVPLKAQIPALAIKYASRTL